jgi:hypothetical protein
MENNKSNKTIEIDSDIPFYIVGAIVAYKLYKRVHSHISAKYDLPDCNKTCLVKDTKLNFGKN